MQRSVTAVWPPQPANVWRSRKPSRGPWPCHDHRTSSPGPCLIGSRGGGAAPSPLGCSGQASRPRLHAHARQLLARRSRTAGRRHEAATTKGAPAASPAPASSPEPGKVSACAQGAVRVSSEAPPCGVTDHNQSLYIKERVLCGAGVSRSLGQAQKLSDVATVAMRGSSSSSRTHSTGKGVAES